MAWVIKSRNLHRDLVEARRDWKGQQPPPSFINDDDDTADGDDSSVDTTNEGSGEDTFNGFAVGCVLSDICGGGRFLDTIDALATNALAQPHPDPIDNRIPVDLDRSDERVKGERLVNYLNHLNDRNWLGELLTKSTEFSRAIITSSFIAGAARKQSATALAYSS